MTVFIERTATSSRLEHRGGDSLDLLNRITTADLGTMAHAESKTTVLTSEKGKTVDLLTVHRYDDTRLIALSDLQDPSRSIAFIDKYTIIEDAQLVDVSRETVQFTILAPSGSKTLSKDLPAQTTAITRLWHGSEFAVELVAATRLRQELRVTLGRLFEERDIDYYQSYCLERAIVTTPPPDSNPLETDLKQFIDFDKGCYIGQEVIARLDTYNKVQRVLVGLKLSSPVANGSVLFAGGKQVGTICASANSPGLGHIALSLIRARLLPITTPLTVNGDHSEVQANVIELPALK